MSRVELRAAKIPSIPGIIADHYWLLVFHSGEGNKLQKCDRWEIWQEAHCNNSCWGHLHKNLLTPYQGVGNGPSQLIQKWIDEEAISIIEKIESSPDTYPFINEYRYWPGPNSNTFAQWVVQDNPLLKSNRQKLSSARQTSSQYKPKADFLTTRSSASVATSFTSSTESLTIVD